MPLSHNPLVWIVREAQRAGLNFDAEKMHELKCGGAMDYDGEDGPDFRRARDPTVPEVQITGAESPETSKRDWEPTGRPEREIRRADLHEHLHDAATQGLIHDCLMFKQGLPTTSVISWKIMEYLPFRRMDLQPDNSWKSIRWPLPKGEVRDIPDGAWIHSSALKRMEHNPNYRPGNLIVGGGGRGVRVAPAEYGMGEWVIFKDEGDPISECLVRKNKTCTEQNGHKEE